MSTRTAKDFYEKVIDNQDILNKVRSISTGDLPAAAKIAEILKIASAEGFQFGKEEFLEHARAQAEKEHAARDTEFQFDENEPHSCFFTDCGTQICSDN